MQTKLIVDSLKKELRKQGIHYEQVAQSRTVCAITTQDLALMPAGELIQVDSGGAEQGPVLPFELGG